MHIGRFWSLLVSAILVGCLLADSVNLIGLWRFRTSEPRGKRIVYEDFRVSDLPDCAFEQVIREEAEPAFYYNLFDWTGLRSVATSAYDNAEYKIWRNLSFGDRSSPGGRTLSSSKQVDIRRELVDERGLQPIRRALYFDERGYHAQLVMGHPRQDQNVPQYSACPVDLDRGRFEVRTVSVSFTCENLERVIADGIQRIATADSSNRCWVSYDYDTDYKAGRVRFREEYFVWTEEDARDVLPQDF